MNLTLEEGSENILKSNSTDAAGIQNIENSLVIDGSGKLVAEGGRNSAGIGGVAWKAGSNITIRGSVEIEAKGGDPYGAHGGGAGIGAGGSGGASNILICENAVVYATGGKNAAGIGASAFAAASNNLSGKMAGKKNSRRHEFLPDERGGDRLAGKSDGVRLLRLCPGPAG